MVAFWTLKGILVSLLCWKISTSAFAFTRTLSSGLVLNRMTMTFNGRSAFLAGKDDVYISTCLRRSVDGTKICLNDSNMLIEVEFPISRKSDLSVSETLDSNRKFVFEFAKAFKNYGKDLWVVFPDNKEALLAKKSMDQFEFTLTSISSAQSAAIDVIPKLIIAVNPGFNVEEWIELPKIQRGAPMIVVNGNLDRLRNGYYPSLFYPGLAKVTKSFYSKAVQAFFLSPIAVAGTRLGAWLATEYPGKWEVLVKTTATTGEYDVVYASETAPEAKFAWSTAKQAFNTARGGSIF